MSTEQAEFAPPAEPKLPALLAPGRRLSLVLLVILGLGAGGLSVAVAWLVGQLASGFNVGTLLVVLGLTLVFFAGKFAERVLAEHLGQHYVAELRSALISHALRSPRGPSVGITVARSSNDLSSIRNWITQGIVPLVAGIPMVLLAGIGLWMLHPMLGVALMIVLLVEIGLLAGLAPGAFSAARSLRRYRGQLAARIADTVNAATSITAAGGVQREVSRIDKGSQKVVAAAIHRAKYAGALRAGALSAPLVGTALVVSVGSYALLAPSGIASALTLMGICAGALGDWGRIVEYRQNYRAGRRIIAPLIKDNALWVERERSSLSTRNAKAILQTPSSIRVRPGTKELERWPVLRASPGERIQLIGQSQHALKMLEALATARVSSDSEPLSGLWIAEGRSEDLPVTERRKLVGAALNSMVLERGSIARALNYRHPGSSLDRAVKLLAECGLELSNLPQAEQTMLRRGGEPLDVAQRTSLLVARALLRNPPVLILDSVIGQLPTASYQRLVDKLNNYPGVLLFHTDLPGLTATAQWGPQSLAVTDQTPARLTDADEE